MTYGYELVTSYVGESLISGFNFSSVPDLSHGYVQYQTKENAEARGLYEITEDDAVIFRVDAVNITEADGFGRGSVRLESKQAYTHGLFIGDFAHMPKPECGVWPAFWAYGPDWPNSGEVDIIEGANKAQKNLMSAHNSANCLLPTEDEIDFTADQLTTDCTVNWDTGNVGCGYGAGDAPATYGDEFNAVGGGVYAMQWESDYIKIWHWIRASIPQDIIEKNPDPAAWGTPLSVFGGSKCDVDTHYNNMNIVININLCGDYAGGIWSADPQCKDKAPRCQDYAAVHPEAFTDAYWEVNYIEAYQRHSSSSSSWSSSSYSQSSTSTWAPSSSPVSSSSSTYSHSGNYTEPTTTSTSTTTTTTTSTIPPHDTTTISLIPASTHRPHHSHSHRPGDDHPAPAPAKGGELETTKVTLTTVAYTTICPTDPASLETTHYVATVTLSNCHCGDAPSTEIDVPMTTTVYACHGCGAAGEDSVTLVVPKKACESPDDGSGVVAGPVRTGGAGYDSGAGKGMGASAAAKTGGGSGSGSDSGSGSGSDSYLKYGTGAAPTVYSDVTATVKPVSAPTYAVVTAGAAKFSVTAGLVVFAGVALFL